ncbi:hypothetical protein ACUODJ_15075, partial [Escherichia sp. HC-CC]
MLRHHLPAPLPLRLPAAASATPGWRLASYQDEFAAIPLVPKAGDRDEPDMMPAATQALPTQPPEGAA